MTQSKEELSLYELVEETFELSRENNRLLKAIRRDAFIGGFLKLVLWGAVLIASFYFAAQYLDPLMNSVSGENGAGSGQFKALIDLYGGQVGQ